MPYNLKNISLLVLGKGSGSAFFASGRGEGGVPFSVWTR